MQLLQLRRRPPTLKFGVKGSMNLTQATSHGMLACAITEKMS